MRKKFYDNVLRAIKLILRLFGFMVYMLSCIVPRKRNVWVFGSYSDSFVDNSKYLFLDVTENMASVKAVWISGDRNTVKHVKNKNLLAYHRWSLKGIYYTLISSKYFYSAYVSDINLWTSGGAEKVNLWHGIPLKKIEFDIKSGPLARIFKKNFWSPILYPAHYVKPDYVLSPTEYVTSLFSSAFAIEKEKCLVYRYPRNEILLKDKNEILNHVLKYETEYLHELIKKLSCYSKVFIYMPTWRDAGNDFLNSSGIDFEGLNNYLEINNQALILKLHPNTKVNLKLECYGNIINFKGVDDVYPLLPFTDCLITDYSSIMFDYALMGKDILYFPFDMNDYLKGREMYFVYSEFIPESLMSLNYQDLIDKITAGCFVDEPGSQYTQLMAGVKEAENLIFFLGQCESS